jgi:hypothetical protein
MKRTEDVKVDHKILASAPNGLSEAGMLSRNFAIGPGVPAFTIEQALGRRATKFQM